MNSKNEIPVYGTLKEFEQNRPQTIEILETSKGDKVYVVGTAHFSLKSQDDVSLAMRNVEPGAVVLELCPLRTQILQLDEKTLLEQASSLTLQKIKDIFMTHGISGGLFYLSFLQTSAKITQQLGIAPGGECRRAVVEAQNLKDCKIFLGDRLIDITLKRAMAGLSYMQRMQLSYFLNFTNSETLNHKLTQEYIDKYRNRDLNTMKILEKEMPTVYNSFVNERDYILAHSLWNTIELLKQYNPIKQARVVGVVGMGHMTGIQKYFGNTKSEKVKEFLSLPQKRWFGSTNLTPGNNMTNLMSILIRNLKFSVTKFL